MIVGFRFRTVLRSVLLPLAVAGLSGCSMVPGMHYIMQSAAPEPPASSADYTVQPITMALLRGMQRVPQQGTNNPALARAIADYSYRVGPHDFLAVTLWGENTLSGTIQAVGAAAAGAGTGDNSVATAMSFEVSPDGSFYFPYVGRVLAGGRTINEIRDRLMQKLKPFLREPQVTVSVSQYNSKKFKLSGAVARPGLYPLTNVPITVSQAIAASGGVINQTPNALTTGNTIVRPLGDLSHVVLVQEGRKTVLDLRAYYEQGDASQDRLLGPEDAVIVPDNSFEQVHLMGEVARPGNYPLNNGQLTLSQLLGDAGGINQQTGDAGQVLVFRGAADKPLVYWLNAQSPDMMLLANAFALNAQDVVYVAPAGLASWNRVVSQLLPTVQTIYETKVLVSP